MKPSSKQMKQADAITGIYEQAQALSRITDTLIDQDTHLITAEFSLYGHRNTCSCTYRMRQSRLVHATCDCAWIHDHGRCPHLRIVQNHIQTSIKEKQPIAYENPMHRIIAEQVNQSQTRNQDRQMAKAAQKSKQMLERYRDAYDRKLTQEIMGARYHIKPQLHIAEGLFVSFRIYADDDYPYTIRSIPEFLTALLEQKDVSYGKYLHFVHHESVFDAFAKRQIVFMRKYGYHRDHLLQTEASDTKMISLYGQTLDDFYTLYESEYETESLSFTLSDGFDDIVIDRKEIDGYEVYRLSDRRTYYFGASHLYELKQQNERITLIKHTLDEDGICLSFIRCLNEEDVIVAKEDAQALSKYVLSILRQYCILSLPTFHAKHDESVLVLHAEMQADDTVVLRLTEEDACETVNHSLTLPYAKDVTKAYLRRYATIVDEQNQVYVMDQNADSTLMFLREGLTFLKNHCILAISDLMKERIKTKDYHFHGMWDYQDHTLLFTVMSAEIPKQELGFVMQAYEQKRKFYRLQDETLLSLDTAEIKELDALIHDIRVPASQLHEEQIMIHDTYLFTVVRRLRQMKHADIRQSDRFAQYVHDFYQYEDLVLHEQDDLRRYQKSGVKWLLMMRRYGFHAVLADDMGLGKRVQTIAYLRAQSKTIPSLVLCPMSLCAHWEMIARRHAPSLRILSISGNRIKREAMLRNHREYDLIISGYEDAYRDLDLYEACCFDTLILDDASSVKQRSDHTLAVASVTADYRLVLCDRTDEISLAKLWAIFNFLMPDDWDSYPQFQKENEFIINTNKDSGKQPEWMHKVSPFILRRRKRDVSSQYGGVDETIRMIPFAPKEYTLYDNQLRLLKQQVDDCQDWQSNHFAIMSQMSSLQQLCCDPRLLYDTVRDVSSKSKNCLELIDQLRQNHQKVIVCSAFISMLELLGQELTQKEISYEIVRDVHDPQAQTRIKRFQDETSEVLLLYATGETMPFAIPCEAIIELDPWWQTTACVHSLLRNHAPLHLSRYRLIMKNSIEEKRIRLQQNQREVQEKETMLPLFQKDEMTALLSDME